MRTKKIAAIYAAGFIQGVALVAFPAASTIFTSPNQFNFSASQYGGMFIPQALFSIISSLFSSRLSEWRGAKSVFIFGLFANLIAMSLFAFSAFAMHQHSWAYALLLLATSWLGIGFGLTVPTLNTMSALLYPEKVDGIILILNALLGVGTAMAPVFIALFTHFGYWWELPLLLAALLILLIFFSLPLQLPGGKNRIVLRKDLSFEAPARFWLFAAFALLYGVIETLNANWVVIYMENYQQVPIAWQSLALASFWGMVTIGRVFFACISKYFSERSAFRLLPFAAAAAFICISLIPEGFPRFSILMFALAGFGCSALLPLTISFGTVQLKSIAESVAGSVIAFYLLGYGLAAFGVGPLLGVAKISIKNIYLLGATIAVALGIIGYIITNRRISNFSQGGKK